MKQIPLRVHVTTMGCSKNLVDSEVLMGRMSAAGYKVIHQDAMEYADVAIINTCGFIEDSIVENIRQIMEITHAKDHGIVKKVIVMGCLVQRFKEQLELEIPEVDKFYGVDEMEQILHDLGTEYRQELLGERMLTTPPHYAYLKIAEGCDRNCSFCIIPEIRGRNKSKSIEELVNETKYLVRQGVKEIILIAQDTTRYGVDLYGKKSLAELLKALEKIDGVRWIRLQYTYPDNSLYDVLEVMKNSSKICHYLDIPLQHINDTVLQSMKRGHSKKIISDLLDSFRNEIPDIAIRTTLITGYPGEGQAEFEELKSFIRQYRFERLGVFAFSPEEGTEAAKLNDDIPFDVKENRVSEIMELQKDISREMNLKKIGNSYTAIVDRREDNTWILRSQYDSPEVDTEIYVKDQPGLTEGQFVKLRITAADDYDLYGEITGE
ncbi:MAG: 30S ribosomal protein S12 methylthiotransferase RimO [Bacteroidales bacterium]|nr:30S ribosomal protein S12 methylthiotransferase RimO [Bacteroidales bacterium]MCF8327897.1 30S ribosomal protein S12 methylthiotransferase RimO [Bacteroidales bacterium]